MRFVKGSRKVQTECRLLIIHRPHINPLRLTPTTFGKVPRNSVTRESVMDAAINEDTTGMFSHSSNGIMQTETRLTHIVLQSIPHPVCN